MILDPEIQALIDMFFSTMELRQLEQCQEILKTLSTYTEQYPELLAWCTYLDGILIYEIHHNWSAAEKIFASLLHTEPELTLRCRLCNALGHTLEIQGRWQEAVDAYEKAFIVANKLGSSLDKIKAWKHMAICYREGYSQGAYSITMLQKAVDYCQKAMAILTALPERSDSIAWLEGSLWNTLGATYRYLESWGDAISCYQRDLAICQQLDDQHGIGISYLNLGEVYHHRSEADWPQALASYDDALRLLRQYQDRYLEADALQNLGSLYQAMGKPTQALAHYTQAVTVIEDLRTRISASEARTGFFTTMVETYSRLVNLLIETGDIPAAFDMVERARSRTFIELLGGQTIRTPQQAPDTLLTREAALRAELNTLYQTPDAESSRIGMTEQKLDATLQEIRLFAAEYADLRSVQPLTHDQVQQRLPAQAALLSYFITDDALYAFVVRNHSLTVHPLPLKPTDLRRAFDEEGNLVRMRPASDGRLHDPWMLRRLYQCLIQPLLAELQGAETLYLLPHGPLHFVPFQALFYPTTEGQTRLLLDDYALVYAPSATVLLDYCQQKRSQAAGSLLALGYNDDLHHAEAETNAIAGLVTGSVALVHEAATTTALFAQAGNFRWVHFACHGRFNRQAPLMSYLRLAGEPLYASDVLQRLRLQADLVTLAACETGRNQVLKGDELIGLVRAFIYAGTPSVVVSLWPVDELSTRILMERFYRELLAGQSKAAALRAAQQYVRNLTASQVTTILTDYGEADPDSQVQRLLALTHTPQTTASAPAAASKNDRVFAHPYFWAPFVLIGDQLTNSVPTQ